MDRKAVILIILLILAAAALFLPAMVKWQGIFHDDQATSEFLLHSFFARNLQKGIMPLWDPHVWCGAIPHYAFIYAGENYYLPLWPFYFFADSNNLDQSYWMLSILPLLMHYILAAIGMFVLLKKIVKCSNIPAFIGAFIYIYSPIFVYGYVAETITIMASWLPWLIFLYVKTLERFRLWKLFLAGLIFAFIWTAGSSHFMPFVMIIWGGFVLSSMITSLRRKRKRAFAKAFLVAGIIFIIGTALGAVYLYSVFDGIQYTQLHMELTPDASLARDSGSLPFPYLATLLLPNLFGGIAGNNFIFAPLMFWEANMSGGMAATLAVILGALLPIMILSKSFRQDNKRRYAIIGVFLYLFAILCALGDATPFYRLAVGWIPIVGGFPSPVRYRMIQCFAASLLIAIGLNFLITSKFSISKYKLRKLVRYFIIFSFFVICAVLFLPQDSQERRSWLGKTDFGVEEFFLLREPVGRYTPTTIRVKKIRVMFDGESEGEIRYSDSNRVLPNEGTLAKRYSVLGEGWAEFDVDTPPKKFLWIYPKSGHGNIGYWEEEQRPSYSYNGKWVIHPGINAIRLYQGKENMKTSLFYKFKNNSIVKTPVVFSIWHWLLASFLIIAAVYFLSPKRFGYFLGIIVLIEFFVFGMMAFYKSTFTDSTPLPQHFRFLRPSDHSMLQDMIMRVPAVAVDPALRIATDYPINNNFVYLNERFALMGYGAYPLEKRFKQAIETAYGQSMDQSISEGISLPGSEEFLNNFSVGYFIDNNLEKVFSKEECVALANDADNFVHINANALPRVYTLDRIMMASEEEQLKRLVADDLRKAAYVDFKEGIESEKETNGDHISHFKDLQQMNPVSRVDFSNPNRIEVDVNVTVPAMLVLTEVWYPGWEATVDGKQTKISRVNYCQRGIWLERGNHQVELEFKPLAWRIGAGISLGTIVLLAGLSVLGLIKRW